MAKVEKTSDSSGDETDTKVKAKVILKVKVKTEVRTEDTEIDRLEGLRIRSLADAANAVKQENEEDDDKDKINIGDVKVKEEPSARSLRAKRRRMM